MSAPDIAPSFGRLVRQVRERLAAGGIDTAAIDARLLVAHGAGLSDAGLIVRERDTVNGDIVERIEEFVGRRLAGEPVARIVGEKEFYGLVFAVAPATLVPRPETELLVEAALTHLANRVRPRFLDLGTGTGAIAIGIAMHCPGATGLATDASAEALATARDNAATYGLGARLGFAQGEWYEAVPGGDRFDVIVANPPYIETAAIDTLAPEVRDFDPRTALDGGADGLEALREVIAGAPGRLVPDGLLAIEIGAGQGAAVTALMDRAGLHDVATTPDLAGLERVVSARLKAD